MSGFFPFSLTNNLLNPPVLTPPVQQDLLSYQGTGQVQNARYINPLTQDFEVNPTNGQLYGDNATNQSVILALTNTFGSTSVLGLGNTFNRQNIPLIGINITSQITNALNQALKTLIANGNIVMGNVNVVQTDQNSVGVIFTYYNQSLNVNQTIQFTTQNGVLNG